MYSYQRSVHTKCLPKYSTGVDTNWTLLIPTNTHTHTHIHMNTYTVSCVPPNPHPTNVFPQNDA